MPVVRLPDDSLGIKSADGVVLPWALGEKRLQDMGLEIPPPRAGLTDASRGATAEFKASDYKGPGSFKIEGAPPIGVPDAGKVASDALAPYRTPETAKAKAAAVEANKQEGAVIRQEAEEAKATGEAPKLRGGARVVSMPDAPGGAQPQAGGGGYRPQLIKGGDTRVAYKIDRKNVDPEALRQAEDAEADASIDSKLAAQSLSDTSAQRSAALAQRMGEQLDAEDMAVARQAEKNQAIEAEYNKRQGEIDAEREAIDKMPIQGAKEILEDRDAFTKLLSGLSIIAGGALQGAGFTRDNPGLTMRDRAVDQAIATQKERRNARMMGLQVRETQLERLQKQYGNPEAAEAELRERIERLFERHAQKAALDSGSQDAAANLQALFAQKDQERAQSRLGRQQALAGSITESFQNIPDRVVGGPAPLKPEARERLITFDGGNGRGFVVAGPAREKVQSGITAYENLMGGAEELANLAAQAHAGNLDAQRKYNSLRGTIMAESNVAVGQGAISKDDQARVEQSLPDVADLTMSRENAVTRLKQFGSWTRSRRDSIIRDNVYRDPNAEQPVMTGRPHAKAE